MNITPITETEYQALKAKVFRTSIPDYPKVRCIDESIDTTDGIEASKFNLENIAKHPAREAYISAGISEDTPCGIWE